MKNLNKKTLVILALGLGLAAALTTPSRAEQKLIAAPVTVVELFTSQGCSSCPRANKFVRGLADNPGVLALSYSVDYWDYLGWKDTFGQAKFSARQRAYGRRQFDGQVYTPQMVLNGAAHSSRYTEAQIESHKLTPPRAPITFTAAQDGIVVQIGKDAALTDNAVIVAVRYQPGVQDVSVARGENRGRTVSLLNVVTESTPVGHWTLADGFSATLDKLPKGEALVILIQNKPGGQLLGAAQYLP